ncbi:MAG: hypothetical protein C5B55_04950 [Blastocatellia bacterium]|nr:MAG: hypothetical protein C5B55_04950 [Blastocatellia bacterium]
MASQQVIADPPAATMSRRLQSVIRLVVAAIVFTGVCCAWIGLLLLFAPFVLIVTVIELALGATKRQDLATPEAIPRSSSGPLLFDRRSDVSKLYGCNTRNVRYRWTLFSKRLATLEPKSKHLKAIDFGAGSLRDSYELAKLGFDTVAFDLNRERSQQYFDSYDWTKVDKLPSLQTGALRHLVENNEGESIQLILAFDVIEHLEDPASYVAAFRRLLNDGGWLFTIVPNRRSLFERSFKRTFKRQQAAGIPTEPGVPHIQFKSPEEWDQFFAANGFEIVDRDMAIGHFVNDWWNGFLSVPLRTFVFPVLEVAAFRTKQSINVARLEQLLCPQWLMERVDVLDSWMKPLTKSRFGWNLIVAEKKTT